MKWALACLLMLGFAFALQAHGDKKHVMGVVEKLASDSVTVKLKDGNSLIVKVAPSTVFIKHSATADSPGKFADLAVGDRVVIHATPKEGGLEADEVKFSASPKPPVVAGNSLRPHHRE